MTEGRKQTWRFGTSWTYRAAIDSSAADIERFGYLSGSSVPVANDVQVMWADDLWDVSVHRHRHHPDPRHLLTRETAGQEKEDAIRRLRNTSLIDRERRMAVVDQWLPVRRRIAASTWTSLKYLIREWLLIYHGLNDQRPGMRGSDAVAHTIALFMNEMKQRRDNGEAHD